MLLPPRLLPRPGCASSPAFAVCSTTIAWPGRDTFSIFVRSSGNRGRCALDFHVSPRDATALFFRISFRPAFRQTCLRCFSPPFFFVAPLFSAIPRKQAVVGAVMANRSRFRVTNVLDPLLFHDRSSLGRAVVKFDGEQKFTWTIARGMFLPR